jgi:hypothetical protein
MNIAIHFDFEDFFRTPLVRVGIDDVELYNGEVLEIIEVHCPVETGPHTFWIEHHGKQINETTNAHDHHIFIKKLYFNDIDLDQLDYCPLTHRGKFYPVYEESYITSCHEQRVDLPEFIQPNHYLGHNGVWRLNFSEPAMLWIIREQNPNGMHLEDTIFSTSETTLNEVKDFFKL